MSTTEIDLNTCGKTQGIISSTKVVDGALLIFLKDNDTGYWIYRMRKNYNSISDNIPVGLPVTIYHNKSVDSHHSYTTYQVENEKGVVYSKKEYQDKEQLAGKYIGFPGGVFMFVAIFFDVRKWRRKLNTEEAVA